MVTDPSRFISVLCPRRAGKTYGFAARMLICALLNPRAQILYTALTGGQAHKNIWTVLEQLDQEFELNGKYNRTKLIYELPNKSKIYLAGVQTYAEVEKLRGQWYNLVIVDEGKSYTDDILSYLMKEVAYYGTTDKLGTVILGGTPGNVLGGYFFGVTPLVGPDTFTEVDPKYAQPYQPYVSRKKSRYSEHTWSFHHWSTEKNIKEPQIWLDFQARKEAYGISDSDPGYRREALGYWAQSDDLSVYRYNAERCGWVADNDGPHGLPSGHDWRYIMGLDLGFHDDTAVVVAAWSKTHDKLYHVYDRSIPHLTVDEIQKLIEDTKQRFPEIQAMIADTGGLGKTIAETLAQRGHPFQTAEKREKYDHIELVNTDLMSGRVRILKGSTLATQMQMLQWEDETFKREDKRTPNHACDAFLYLWRYAHHHFWRPEHVEPQKYTDEWFERWDAECAAKAAEAHKTNTSRKLDQVPANIRLDHIQ